MTVCKKIFAVSLACALLAANVYAQDDWGSDGATDESAELTFWDRFKISGDATLAGRAYFDSDKASSTELNVIPRFKLGFDYEGNSTKFNSKIRLDEQTLKYDNEMILDEFSANLFVGNWVLSAGKMRVVWGKGDKLHVLDNFNANNYYDFLTAAPLITCSARSTTAPLASALKEFTPRSCSRKHTRKRAAGFPKKSQI